MLKIKSARDSIYIHHEWRGRGVGSLLLAELIRLAKDIGHHTVLGGADAEQEGSIALHVKFGFEKVSHLKEVGFKTYELPLGQTDFVTIRACRVADGGEGAARWTNTSTS